MSGRERDVDTDVIREGEEREAAMMKGKQHSRVPSLGNKEIVICSR